MIVSMIRNSVDYLKLKVIRIILIGVKLIVLLNFGSLLYNCSKLVSRKFSYGTSYSDSSLSVCKDSVASHSM